MAPFMGPLTGHERVPRLVVVLVKPSRAFQRGGPLLRTLRRLVVWVTPHGGAREREAEPTPMPAPSHGPLDWS
ncbi:hypothetical protein KY284_012904 [Solanum tuberosum]|nr:hypothetical protein KY284_012904 [Solanum tuberosum]